MGGERAQGLRALGACTEDQSWVRQLKTPVTPVPLGIYPKPSSGTHTCTHTCMYISMHTCMYTSIHAHRNKDEIYLLKLLLKN